MIYVSLYTERLEQSCGSYFEVLKFFFSFSSVGIENVEAFKL